MNEISIDNLKICSLQLVKKQKRKHVHIKYNYHVKPGLYMISILMTGLYTVLLVSYVVVFNYWPSILLKGFPMECMLLASN